MGFLTEPLSLSLPPCHAQPRFLPPQHTCERLLPQQPLRLPAQLPRRLAGEQPRRGDAAPRGDAKGFEAEAQRIDFIARPAGRQRKVPAAVRFVLLCCVAVGKQGDLCVCYQ